MRRLALAAMVLALAVTASSALAQGRPSRPDAPGPGGPKGKCHKGQVSKHGRCIAIKAKGIQGGTYGDSTNLFEIDTAKKTVAFYFGPFDCGVGQSYSGEPGSRVRGKLPSTNVGTTFKLSGTNRSEAGGFITETTWNVQGHFPTFNVLKETLHLKTVETPIGGVPQSCEKTFPLTLFVTAA
jgi:hypothetical protein